jgi:LPXTG-motif cell wall-anchored protein
MKEGEIVTLTYTAKINLLNEPGTYKDIAFVQGDSLLAEKDSGDVLGISYDPSEYLHTDKLGNNFVGTNVLVVEPIEEGGEVLGISTTLTLPKTGAETYITLGAIISMILGILLFVFGKKRKLNTILLSTVLLFGIFTLVKPIQTYAQVPVAKVSVRLEQPKTGLTDREFNITYVALSIPVKPITVQCQYSLDGVNFSNFDTLKATNSGDCKVDQSIVTGSGTYYFKAVATVEGVSPVESEVVSVNITNNPSPVTEYSKTKTACIYTLKFKSSTSKVQIFRSDNQKSFYADDTTLITKPYLTVTPNVLSTYTDTPTDCSKEYYYAVRAVDEYSNVSTLVTDNVVTVIEQTQTSTPQESEEVAGEQTTTQQEQETTSTGEVAGEETTSQQEEETKTDTKEETETEEEETKESIWDKYKYLIISLIVVVLGSGIYSYIRRKK